jgi:hypothetical protein
MSDDNPLYEFHHPSGMRLRIPKGFTLDRAPDSSLQLVTPTGEHIQFYTAVLEDLYHYLKAAAWHESDAMTPISADWTAFIKRLKGKAGINLRREDWNKKLRYSGPHRYSCEHENWDKAVAILKQHFPRYDMQDTLAYFSTVCGAECDCAVVFNVDGIFDRSWNFMRGEMLRRGKGTD